MTISEHTLKISADEPFRRFEVFCRCGTPGGLVGRGQGADRGGKLRAWRNGERGHAPPMPCLRSSCSTGDAETLSQLSAPMFVPAVILTPGQRGDAPLAQALLEGLSPRRVLADKAYDSNALRHLIASIGAEAVIPCDPPRKELIPYDFEVYKVRNTIERCFNKLKHFRRIATRFDRRAAHFLGFLQIAAALLLMR